MDVFAIIRRSISGAVATALLLIGCLYLAVSMTLLTTDGLTDISKKAGLAKIMREDMILPHILDQTNESAYSHLLSEKAVTNAFNTALPDKKLEEKIQPAIQSTRDWLDSKSSDITFTIDTSDASKAFHTELIKSIKKSITKLPECTYENSLSDAEYGVCKSPYISTEEIQKSAAEVTEANPTMQLSKITADSITIPESVLKTTKNIPDYINMLYALSLLTTGIALIIILRLILKHKINGIITLGGICIALSITLFIGSTLLTQTLSTVANEQFLQNIAIAVGDGLQGQLQRQAVSLGGIGIITVIVFGGIKLLITKYGSKRRA